MSGHSPNEMEATLPGRHCIRTFVPALAAALALALGAAAVLAGDAEPVDWVARFRAKQDELRARGEPPTIEELVAGLSDIPDEENSALILLRAFPGIEAAPEGSVPDIVGEDAFDVELGVRRSQTFREMTAAQLDAYSDALATIHEAARLPHGRFPVELVENPFEMLLPHLGSLRQAGRLCGWEASHRAMGGDAEGTVESLLAMRRLASSLDGGWTLIDALVRIAVDTLFVRSAEHALGLVELPPDGIAALRAQLAAEMQSLSLTTPLMAERACGAWLLDAAPGAIDELTGADEPSLLSRIMMNPQTRARDLLCHYGLMEAVIEASRLPPRERLAAGPRIEQQVMDAPPYARLTKLLMPALSRVLVEDVKAHALLAVADTALAIELWRLEHGDWPESLDRLVPELLESVPEDPFSEAVLLYARTLDGAVVYSVGQDGFDDGGNDPDRDWQAGGTDIRFRLLDPELRGARELGPDENLGLRGRTLLHVAAERGDLDGVARLLDHGADPNTVDDDGWTPTGLAVKAGHEAIAALLREHGGIE